MSVLHRSIELLEPYDGKLSRTVRERGEELGNRAFSLVHSLIQGNRKGALNAPFLSVYISELNCS